MQLKNDLNVLTNIPEESLDRMCHLIVMAICMGVWESKQDGEDITTVDTGIGTLYVKAVGSDFKFGFEPSDEFRKELKKTAESDSAPLMPKLIGSLRDKFMEVYKEIC